MNNIDRKQLVKNYMVFVKAHNILKVFTSFFLSIVLLLAIFGYLTRYLEGKVLSTYDKFLIIVVMLITVIALYHLFLKVFRSVSISKKNKEQLLRELKLLDQKELAIIVRIDNHIIELMKPKISMERRLLHMKSMLQELMDAETAFKETNYYKLLKKTFFCYNWIISTI